MCGRGSSLSSALTIPVLDPFGVTTDPALPSLAAALDPGKAARLVPRRLARLAGEPAAELRAIRVARYKPGRRCLVEYDVEVRNGDDCPELVTLIGKVQRGRYGNSGYRQLDALWRAGFAADSADGISVPEAMGTVPRFRMWFQRRVPGVPAGELLAGPGADRLAERIAEAAHKLHRAGVRPERAHGMADEIRILEACLADVAGQRRQWAARLDRLLDACRRLAARTPEPAVTGIHRDFYADQVLVDGDRLTLVDFDLYCVGDPGLDIGNFLGHLTEQGLREHGDPEALAVAADALERRFVELAGEPVRPSVRAYAALTLARHVYLSGLLPERHRLTPALLELAEERVFAEAGGHAR